jgi:hypothetical protein
MTLLLAVFKTLALVVLKQTVLSAEVATAEPTVANDSLRRITALFVTASDLLGGHAAA